MAAQQEKAITYNELNIILQGHVAFQMVRAGVELGVFDALSAAGQLKEDELSSRVGLGRRATRVLLTGLRALRVVESHEGALRNSEMAEAVLTRRTPTSWVSALSWQRDIVYPGAVDFVEALREETNVGLRRFPEPGADLYTRLSNDPELEKGFQDSMSALSRSANALLLDSTAFEGARHVVDLGGGDGTNAIALAKRFPHLRVTVFDRETVCERARANIAEAGLSDRVKVHPGNLFEDALPQDADVMLLSHMLTIWSPEKNIRLLRRVRDALPEGGRAVVFNMMADDEGDGPISAALGSLYFLTIATGEGMLYRWSEYELFLREAGFALEERRVLPRDHGVLVGRR